MCRERGVSSTFDWRPEQDNNWLLLEFALALPFAIGLKTALVSRLLALTLALEAFTCWPFWANWPNWCGPTKAQPLLLFW